jgi:hypothetical protein
MSTPSIESDSRMVLEFEYLGELEAAFETVSGYEWSRYVLLVKTWRIKISWQHPEPFQALAVISKCPFSII